MIEIMLQNATKMLQNAQIKFPVRTREGRVRGKRKIAPTYLPNAYFGPLKKPCKNLAFYLGKRNVFLMQNDAKNTLKNPEKIVG